MEETARSGILPSAYLLGGVVFFTLSAATVIAAFFVRRS
jgi:hypothetical protein